jgi:hypothetical protein
MSELKAYNAERIYWACEQVEQVKGDVDNLQLDLADYYLKSEADNVIAHNKYKRCLAMASKCRLRARWFGDNAFYKKEQWALQWHRRWLELAEKFKEAK